MTAAPASPGPWVRGPAAVLLLTTVLLLAVAGPAHAVEVGLGDQKPAAFADARARALGLRHARLIVPWNAASSEPARVQAWLDAVAAAGLAPHVAFEHLRTDDCPGSPCVLPSRAQYRAAVAAFHARWPQVRTFTTWNEANHVSQPVARRPEVAAGYWEELIAACSGCTVVAGDVLDSGGYVRWLERFSAATDGRPRRWGLHNYGDVAYGRTTGTDDVLAAVPGELWIEETGGIVTLRSAAGRITLSTNEARAEAGIDRAFAIAAARPRIARMYLYQWQAFVNDRFDAGLTRPDGSLRASYAAVVRNLATPTATAAPAPRIRARWSKVKRHQLLLRITCRAGDRRCRGTVIASLRTRTTPAAKERARRLGRRRYRTFSTRGTIALRVNVSRALRLRARRSARRRLAVRVTPTLPSGAARSFSVVLPRRP